MKNIQKKWIQLMLVILAFLVTASLAQTAEDYDEYFREKEEQEKSDSWWSNDDCDLFDLVEELNGTFYDFMGLEFNATEKAVARQFRILSLKLHPDRNPDPQAETQFRQLASIAEILRDKKRRETYHNVLENGLPNWKNGMYYFRKARKFGSFELAIAVSLIVTFGHYVVVKAAYFGKKWDVEGGIKKTRKMTNEDVLRIRDDILSELGYEKPNFVQDNLPRKMLMFTVFLVTSVIPALVSILMTKLTEKKTQVIVEEEPEPTVVTRNKRGTQPKTRHQPMMPDYSNEKEAQVTTNGTNNGPSKVDFKTGKWTDDELRQLVKLTKKFPAGTTDRWEKVAEPLGRNPDEVIKKANTIKSGDLKFSEPLVVSKSSLTPDVKEGSISVSAEHARDEEEDEGEGKEEEEEDTSVWTYWDQSLLEEAMKTHPKGVEQRLDKIAQSVPGKSKDECMKRIKWITEMIKNKKKTPN